jgi:1-acyl-sn-glycerol-3-phosphate acyltransferase
MSEEKKQKRPMDTYWILKRGTLVLLRPWATFYIQGAENVPKEGPVLYVSNHTSYLDPVAIGNVSPRRVVFMGKAELFKTKILNWLLRGVDGFPVKRGEADMSAVKAALGFLKSGRVVCIFPEGTRQNSEEELGQPESGAATFAMKTGCPVVPVFVGGAQYVLGKKGGLKLGKITVAFGEPYTIPKTADRDIAGQEMMDAVARTRDHWRGKPATRVGVFSPIPPMERKD